MSTARRIFLLQIAACAAAGCSWSQCRSPAGVLEARPRHLVDLTHTLSPSFPFIPVKNKTFPFRMAPIATLAEDGVYANRWELTEHVGTHLDAPSHFAANGVSVEGIPLESLIAPLVMVSIAERVARDPDAMLGPDDLRAWEALHGRIPDGAAVFLYSGWAARTVDPPSFVNLDARGIMHFPGFSEAGVDFLVRERFIRGVGVDTLSVDAGKETAYPAHKRLFAAGKWAVECLNDLDRVPPSGASVLVAPVKVKGASGAPARVIAFW